MKLVSLVASLFASLAVANSAWAEGCTQASTDNPKATTIVNMKGVYSCADIQGRTAVAGSYTMNANGSLNWTSNGQRVTEVLVAGTAGGQTCEYVYPNGATEGHGLGYEKSTGAYQNVQNVALCTDNAPPPPPPLSRSIPTCQSLNASGGLDGLQITCPSDTTKQSVIYNFEYGKSFFNTDGTPIACVCNSAALPECDPNKKAGEVGACISANGSKLGAEIPVIIEVNNDPYTCKTYGSTKICNCLYDADPTVVGCQ